MGYYDQHRPPVRDQRLSIGDSYSGSACEMLDCAHQGCMIAKGRRFWQTNSCQMQLSLLMACTIENSCIILHGPLGCGATMHGLSVSSLRGRMRRGKNSPAPVWLSTNLREEDVINGGEQKLYETILHTDHSFRPEIIFVISTCTPNIIGDDVESVVLRASRNAAAHIAAIHCPGFKTRVVASAYDSFYHALLRYIPLEPVPRKASGLPEPDYDISAHVYEYQKKWTVNLWNATSIGPDDEEELIRLLNVLGLNVRIYAEYSNANEFRLVSEAALNISMCNVHDDYLLGFLKEKYGIPYLICGMPLGFAATGKWFRAVAEHFGLEDKAEKLIAAEERELREAIAPMLPLVKGKTVLVCGGIVRSSAEAVMLKELGLKVIAMRGYHYDSGVDPLLEELAEELPEMPIAVSNQLFELLNQVKRLKPDLVLSHAGTQGHLAKAGVTSIQLFDVEKACFGYTGIFRLLRRIVFALLSSLLRTHPTRIACRSISVFPMYLSGGIRIPTVILLKVNFCEPAFIMLEAPSILADSRTARKVPMGWRFSPPPLPWLYPPTVLTAGVRCGPY
jgi:nitrogenase molybdenum-iron protein alpha chain